MRAKSLHSIWLFVMPWTEVHQTPLSMGFPRQGYRSRLPFPPSGGLPDPGIKPTSPALAGGFFTTEPPGKVSHWISTHPNLTWPHPDLNASAQTLFPNKFTPPGARGEALNTALLTTVLKEENRRLGCKMWYKLRQCCFIKINSWSSNWRHICFVKLWTTYKQVLTTLPQFITSHVGICSTQVRSE